MLLHRRLRWEGPHLLWVLTLLFHVEGGGCLGKRRSWMYRLGGRWCTDWWLRRWLGRCRWTSTIRLGYSLDGAWRRHVWRIGGSTVGSGGWSCLMARPVRRCSGRGIWLAEWRWWLLLRHVVSHEWRWINVLIMRKLGSVGVLLGVWVGDGLVQGGPHGYVVREICWQASVKVDWPRLKVGRKSSVLHGKVIIFLFVHLLIDHVLFGDSQRTPGASLMNLRGPSCRFDSGLETAVTSPGGCNVGAMIQWERVHREMGDIMPYRSWFSSWVRSVFKAFAGGMVRWGGMLIRFAVSGGEKRIWQWSFFWEGRQLLLGSVQGRGKNVNLGKEGVSAVIGWRRRWVGVWNIASFRRLEPYDKASKGGDKPQEEKADDNPRDGGERVDGEKVTRIEKDDWKKDDWGYGNETREFKDWRIEEMKKWRYFWWRGGKAVSI